MQFFSVSESQWKLGKRPICAMLHCILAKGQFVQFGKKPIAQILIWQLPIAQFLFGSTYLSTTIILHIV